MVAGRKEVARKAFDLALQRELEMVMIDVKKRAETIKQPCELWDLEHHLTESRKRINERFDYRYSVLIFVFANLLREGRLSEQELEGLSDDKLDAIHRFTAL